MVTVAIIAHAHSGSTMLAGIVEILGIPMVGKDHNSHWEDNEVVRRIEDPDDFCRLVEERNAGGSWGFKFLGAWRYPESLEHLANPVYLAIFKSPVSVTRRRFNRECTRSKLHSTLNQMHRFVDGLKDTSIEPHFLAYHDAIADPHGFVMNVAKLIRVRPDGERLNKAVRFIQPNTSGNFMKSYPRVEEFL